MNHKTMLSALFLVFITLTNNIHIHAQPVPVSKNLEIIQIADNVYIHCSYFDLENFPHCPANGLIVVDNGKALIVDTPWTDTETVDLIDWVQKTLNADVAGCIVTHWHIDCMGGLQAVHDAGIPSYANQMTCEITQEKGLPLPQTCFNDSMTVSWGNQTTECYYPGAGHSLDNIVVYFPVSKILFAGCLVKSINSHNLGNTSDGDVNAYPQSLQNVLNRYPECQIVVPGHGQQGNLELIHHTLDLAKALNK